MPETKNIRTVQYKGKTVELSDEVMESLIGREGLYSDTCAYLKKQTSLVIARSGEKSSQNYNLKLNIRNLVLGDRRMGGNIWIQPSVHTTDDEDIKALKQEYPLATVKLTERKVVKKE